MEKNLIQKIYEIQGELKAPKSQRNNFGNYNYRSCEDILEAVKSLLVKAGLLLTITDEVILVENRFYVRATAVITDGEKEIKTTAYARESLEKKGMDSSQITGATSSYARKYALNGLFLIDDTKDADTMDNTESKPKTNTSVSPESITKEIYEKQSSTKQEQIRAYFAKKNGLAILTKDAFYQLRGW